MCVFYVSHSKCYIARLVAEHAGRKYDEKRRNPKKVTFILRAGLPTFWEKKVLNLTVRHSQYCRPAQVSNVPAGRRASASSTRSPWKGRRVFEGLNEINIQIATLTIKAVWMKALASWNSDYTIWIKHVERIVCSFQCSAYVLYSHLYYWLKITCYWRVWKSIQAKPV